MTDKEVKEVIDIMNDAENVDDLRISFINYVKHSQVGISIKEIIDILNYQRAEIERLQGERDVMLEDLQFRTNQVIEQQAEIERLTINMNAFGLGMKREKERADQIKAEAIKEYADILAEKFIVLFNLEYNQAENLRMIVKQMAKKMVGEDK